MIKKKYVVAGNLGEYNDFMRRHQDTPDEVFVYVDNHLQLIGRTNIEGYYTGTYYKRRDIDRIKDIITTSKNTNYPIDNEYTVELVKELDNNHVIAYKYHQIED
jgi:hypothetical protein